MCFNPFCKKVFQTDLLNESTAISEIKENIYQGNPVDIENGKLSIEKLLGEIRKRNRKLLKKSAQRKLLFCLAQHRVTTVKKISFENFMDTLISASSWWETTGQTS